MTDPVNECEYAVEDWNHTDHMISTLKNVYGSQYAPRLYHKIHIDTVTTCIQRSNITVIMNEITIYYMCFSTVSSFIYCNDMLK